VRAQGRVKRWIRAAALIGALLVHRPAQAESDVPDGPEAEPAPSHGPGSQLWDLKLELAGVFGLITYAGIRDWKWGTAYWRFNPEGWFGMNTGSGGQDKLGHAYGTYVMSELFYLRLRTKYGKAAPVTVYPPLFALTIQLYVEVFDGFSVDHGFSYEDVIMDGVGAGAAFLRRAFPAVGSLLDYRLEYFPSDSTKGFHPMIDYSGQKFLLAFRPGRLEPLQWTTARFVEFYLGYYTRGFQNHVPGTTKLRRLYVGVGVDLQGILSLAYRLPEENPGDWFDYLNTALGVFQPPYPYPKASLHERAEVD
jgi:hypothetical protein